MNKNLEIFDEVTYVYSGGKAIDWSKAWEILDRGIFIEEIRGTGLDEALDDLMDFGLINKADDPDDEQVRQATEVLRRDLAACQRIWEDPTTGGEDVSIRDGKLVVRGHEYPGPGGYESPYWQFVRVQSIGAFWEIGIDLA